MMNDENLLPRDLEVMAEFHDRMTRRDDRAKEEEDCLSKSFPAWAEMRIYGERGA